MSPVPKAIAAKYPQHTKLAARMEENRAIVNFIEWFTGEWTPKIDKQIAAGTVSAMWTTQGYDGSQPKSLYELTESQRATILAEYFDINEKALELEKRAMLEDLQP